MSLKNYHRLVLCNILTLYIPPPPAGKYTETFMPRQLVPEGAIEGTVLSIEFDDNETQRRKEKISGMLKSLWED